MRRHLLRVAWLTALWVVLWRSASVANLVSGLALASIVAAAGAAHHTGGTHRVRPVALVRFVAHFAWKLLEANVVIAREVVTPQNDIRTGIVAVPLPGCSDLLVALVANAVSLTPGTLTLEARRGAEPVLFVHVLHLHDVDAARRDVARTAALARAAVEVQPGTDPTSGRNRL